MRDEQWQRLMEWFDRAVDLAPDERAKLVAEARAEDPAVADQLLWMLEADEGETADIAGIVDASAEGAAAPVLPLPEPGDTIGAFEVLERVGEGGMGVVFRARQTDGVDRDVALKIIKPGVDTLEVLRRFERERAILARLDHPGVSHIYDAGSTERGLPYFAMEFLDGLPLHEYCDTHRLGTRERMTLFLELCEIVAHAHARGILHRDLKPTNVLVVRRGDADRPVLIDFGVARALDPGGFDLRWTRVGRTPGTPAYMSPEQLVGDPEEVDTRSDVYALGVILYELLVGGTPGNSSRPSTRLSILGDEAREVAERRSTDLGSLLRTLQGDLDWIVVRALERDAALRYESVADLAEDLARYLDDRPVRARPADLGYRVRKIARRHPLPTAVAAMLLLSLFGALAATLVLGARTRAAQRLAESRLEQIERLSDRVRLEDARAEAGALGPPVPSRIPAMEAWLATHEPLAERIEVHRATRDSLRAFGRPESVPSADTVRVRLAGWSEVIGRAIDAWRDDPVRRDSVALLAARADSVAEELAALPGEDRRWRFDDASTQWWHDRLDRLVAELEIFADPDVHRGLLAGVAHRLDRARAIRELMARESVVGAWERARRSIADSPRYGGLRISVQEGLVPLGPDPESGLEEFWHVPTGARPSPAPDGSPSRWTIDGETGVVLVLVPGGRFLMGAQSTDPGAVGYDPDAEPLEAPVHAVDLDPFFVSKYEMTVGQWLRSTGVNPVFARTTRDRAPEDRLDRAVEFVSRSMSESLLSELGLVLPTEAQWEYAARAGASGAWFWAGGGNAHAPFANLADSRLGEANPTLELAVSNADDGAIATATVGSYRANAFGLHDVIGNVSEWVWGAVVPYDAEDASHRAGDGLLSGPFDYEAALRGGSSRVPPTAARLTARLLFRDNVAEEHLGLRPARRIDPDE